MAINTKTPILPIGAVLPFNYKPKNRWYIKPSIIDVYIGKPTDVNQYDELGIHGLMDHIEKELKILIKE